ncbi:MAG: protein TolR [Deltaproteobacteria bacterium CG_4_10_14_0_2_um_filter_43_8]|nr:MAG: protein TolR [Deltaproteobacteria bacterium CG11_big_fil_rev_8_21_14_0_20_42_23]PJA21469.1 MAG: protein TolR [Deltaproteobacteria bacterium CG_4_10_14_0_2_um_filter_43_8]PJC63378.1 MAG: protein TolR [Deltaproteobacteria bacterium CG_4_9_14_0_2_um_filter_42_21]
MALISSSSRERRTLSEINITPFVDVMLVLLIIFMVTAPMLQQGLPVNLPEASAPSLKRTKQDVVVTIKNNGTLFLGDDSKTLSMEDLESELKAIYALKENKDLFIKADSDLLYGKVVKIMAIAKKAGASRIGMLTQPERG